MGILGDIYNRIRDKLNSNEIKEGRRKGGEVSDEKEKREHAVKEGVEALPPTKPTQKSRKPLKVLHRSQSEGNEKSNKIDMPQRKLARSQTIDESQSNQVSVVSAPSGKKSLSTILIRPNQYSGRDRSISLGRSISICTASGRARSKTDSASSTTHIVIDRPRPTLFSKGPGPAHLRIQSMKGAMLAPNYRSRSSSVRSPAIITLEI